MIDNIKSDFYIFILILVAINTVITMKPNEFCSLSDKLFKNVKCKNYQCSADICTVNQVKCEKFIEWTNLISKYMNADFAKDCVVLYKRFISEIENCPDNKYILLRSELCKRKRICYEKKTWSSRLMFKGVNILEKKLCRCKGKHKFDCINGFCASSKEICDHMFGQYHHQYSHVLNQTRICI